MSRREFAHSKNPGFDGAESVLLLPFGRDSFLKAAVERHGGERVELDETTDRMVYRLAGEPPVTLIYSGMGAPAAANALEMAAANGARRVVLFGACGGIDPRATVGSLIVASGGVRGEGTSRYYAPAEFPAVGDPEMTAALRRAAEDSGLDTLTGVVYTTDASYRQGAEIYEAHAGLAVAVECECAAACVVSARLGLALGALLFVTDNVNLPQEADRSYRGLRDERVERAFEAGLDAALAALRG